MATGDVQDYVFRIKNKLPQKWFSESAPVLNGLVYGLAWSQAQTYAWIQYTIQQTRIGTATGQWLDDICRDFLGIKVYRNLNESDTVFRNRIKVEILRPKATRSALYQQLNDLTGFPPLLFEPRNASDCGGYSSLTQSGGGVGYNKAGSNGSINLSFQGFATIYRPKITNIANIVGYGSYTQSASSNGKAGYNTLNQSLVAYGPQKLTTLKEIQGASDDTIYQAINSVRPACTTTWVRVQNIPPVVGSKLDIDFVLDISQLA
jgi:hypothetical protein